MAGVSFLDIMRYRGEKEYRNTQIQALKAEQKLSELKAKQAMQTGMLREGIMSMLTNQPTQEAAQQVRDTRNLASTMDKGLGQAADLGGILPQGLAPLVASAQKQFGQGKDMTPEQEQSFGMDLVRKRLGPLGQMVSQALPGQYAPTGGGQPGAGGGQPAAGGQAGAGGGYGGGAVGKGIIEDIVGMKLFPKQKWVPMGEESVPVDSYGMIRGPGYGHTVTKRTGDVVETRRGVDVIGSRPAWTAHEVEWFDANGQGHSGMRLPTGQWVAGSDTPPGADTVTGATDPKFINAWNEQQGGGSSGGSGSVITKPVKWSAKEEGALEDMASFRAHTKAIDEIRSIMGAKDGQIPQTGPMEPIRRKMDNWGIMADRKRVRLRALVAQLTELIYKMRGKQLSDTEYKQAEKMIPSMELAPETFAETLASFEDYVKRAAEAKGYFINKPTLKQFEDKKPDPLGIR